MSQLLHKKFRDKFRNSKINYNVKNGSTNKDIDKFKWNITIIDVRTDDADQYFQDIRLWASDVLTVIESARS